MEAWCLKLRIHLSRVGDAWLQMGGLVGEVCLLEFGALHVTIKQLRK